MQYGFKTEVKQEVGIILEFERENHKDPAESFWFGPNFFPQTNHYFQLSYENITSGVLVFVCVCLLKICCLCMFCFVLEFVSVSFLCNLILAFIFSLNLSQLLFFLCKSCPIFNQLSESAIFSFVMQQIRCSKIFQKIRLKDSTHVPKKI